MLDKINLPEGCFLVKPEIKEKTSLIITSTDEKQEYTNKGTIVKVASIGVPLGVLAKRIVFRDFYEEIELGGETYFYFRDYNTAVYFNYE